MQLANFIAVQPVQNFLIQLRGMVVKNNLAFGHADNPRAIFTHQLHRMQVYHYEVTEAFRIHVVIESGYYKIIRLDPRHKVHRS